MEEKLNSILDSIEKYYYSDMDNHDKALIVSEKWSEYFILASKYNYSSDRAYDLFLLGENSTFIVDAVNNIYNVSLDEVVNTVSILNNVLEKRKNDEDVGISLEQANLLLKWSVSNTRKQFLSLGIDVVNNSLNGLCDLAQISSLIPFENIGLSVTKNSIENSFGSSNHHVFGTVTFPISSNGTVENITFLIDPTYRQFFTGVRCNEGRYYMSIEDNNVLGPDPGYFMDNNEKIQFSNELINNGFIVLNDDNAKIYGDGFSYSNIPLSKFSDESLIVDNTPGSYYVEKINNTSSDYFLDISDLEDYGFITSFPDDSLIKNSIY